MFYQTEDYHMIAMATLREVIRLLLLFSDYSDRKIERITRCTHQTIGKLRKKLSTKVLSAEQFKNLNDDELASLFYPKLNNISTDKVQPDLKGIYQEVTKSGKHKKSLIVMYLEYRIKYGIKAYGKTRFFELVRKYLKSHRVVMKQFYLPGEVLFIDYAGSRVDYTVNGKIKMLYVFVACLGFSKKLFAFATKDMTSNSWLQGLEQALRYYGGVPEVITFDNAKAMVTKSGRQAVLNDNASSFARHYQCICDTSRVGTPTDNANAESSVKFITQRVLVPMKRDLTFFNQTEVNQHLQEKIEQLNNKKFDKLTVSRNDLFEQKEQAQLALLPITPYKTFHTRRALHVPANYLILHDDHYYSVPYHLVHKKVVIEVTDKTLEVFYQSQLVAQHLLSDKIMERTQIAAHMKPEHLAEQNKNKGAYMEWAHTIGEDVENFIDKQYEQTRNTHSRAIGKRCATLQKLCDTCGEEVFSAACHYALKHSLLTPTDLSLIIRAKAYQTSTDLVAPSHKNVRGKLYFIGESTHE